VEERKEGETGRGRSRREGSRDRARKERSRSRHRDDRRGRRESGTVMSFPLYGEYQNS